MGVIAKYMKAAAERKRYSIDYSNWLDTGEAVGSVVFTVNVATTPPLVIDGVQVTANATGVQYYVSGGVDNQAYIVTATLQTTLQSVNSQVKIDDIFFTVREPA